MKGDSQKTNADGNEKRRALQGIAYVSTAIRMMSEVDLEELLVEARDLNLQTGTTGVLLYSAGTFFQYFEATEDVIQVTYQRIKDSRKHTGIIELLNEPIVERSFCDWQMGFALASQSQVLALSTANWRHRVETSELDSSSAGLAMLLDFWSRTVG